MISRIKIPVLSTLALSTTQKTNLFGEWHFSTKKNNVTLCILIQMKLNITYYL